MKNINELVCSATNILFNSKTEKRSRDDMTSIESSAKKTKVTPQRVDETLPIVKEVLAREREIVTRSSVLKGTKNFTHAINLAKQLVLGKEVPVINGRSGNQQKPGGKLKSLHTLKLCISDTPCLLFSHSIYQS